MAVEPGAWRWFLQLALKSAILVILGPHRWSLRATMSTTRELLAEALGFYRRAYQLSVTPADFLAWSMATIAFPVASRLHEPERLARGYLLAVAGVAIIGLPLGAFLAVIAPGIG